VPLLNLTDQQGAQIVSLLIKAGETQLATQIANGELVPTFSTMLAHEAKRQEARLKPYADAAREQYHRDGSIEIDEYSGGFAIVSESDDPGAYVMAWVWVDDADAGITREGADADAD
jgi:hypothetical protein